jgi:Na+-driven multidrug efflux pump
MPPEIPEESRKHLTEEDTPFLPVEIDDGRNPDALEAPLFSKTIKEIMIQSKIALPTLQGMVFTKIPWLISLRFVGGIGAPELAAAALATTLCNVTGMSLSVGLSSALSTLSGQAKGELESRVLHDKQRRISSDMAESGSFGNELDTPGSALDDEPITPIIFFWRGMVIQLCVIVPVALWWLIGIKSTLMQLGQTELLSTMTEAYLRVLAPGLLGYSISWT